MISFIQQAQPPNPSTKQRLIQKILAKIEETEDVSKITELTELLLKLEMPKPTNGQCMYCYKCIKKGPSPRVCDR